MRSRGEPGCLRGAGRSEGSEGPRGAAAPPLRGAGVSSGPGRPRLSPLLRVGCVPPGAGGCPAAGRWLSGTGISSAFFPSEPSLQLSGFSSALGAGDTQPSRCFYHLQCYISAVLVLVASNRYFFLL